jgi:hypothetical protein
MRDSPRFHCPTRAAGTSIAAPTLPCGGAAAGRQGAPGSSQNASSSTVMCRCGRRGSCESPPLLRSRQRHTGPEAAQRRTMPARHVLQVDVLDDSRHARWPGAGSAGCGANSSGPVAGASRKARPPPAWPAARPGSSIAPRPAATRRRPAGLRQAHGSHQAWAVGGEHQRGQVEAGSHAVAHAGLALDRHTLRGQVGHVAVHRAQRYLQALGQVGGGGQAPAADQLHQLEQAVGASHRAAMLRQRVQADAVAFAVDDVHEAAHAVGQIDAPVAMRGGRRGPPRRSAWGRRPGRRGAAGAGSAASRRGQQGAARTAFVAGGTRPASAGPGSRRRGWPAGL